MDPSGQGGRVYIFYSRQDKVAGVEDKLRARGSDEAQSKVMARRPSARVQEQRGYDRDGF